MQAERKARIYVTSYYDHPKNASIVSSFCVYTLSYSVWIGWRQAANAIASPDIRHYQQRVA